MQARTVSPRVNVETDFRRYVESPCIFIGFKYIESGLQLCILCTEFYTHIRLECTATVPRITCGKTERQLEYGMLLVGIQTAARTDRQGLTAEIFMVAMISQEASQSKVGRQEVTAFKGR